MDLIDRYLAAVRRHLPRKLQDDVIQELSANLRSEAEEREQDTGRALNADEQAALLKKQGHPWLMASRYLPQQQLIGPSLYPYYRQALVLVLFWVVLPIALFGGAIAAIYSQHPAAVWSRVLGSAWNGGIYAVGIVTLVFAVLERERVRITALDNWNPARLPDPADGRTVPRSETIPGLVATLTFLVWWTEIVRVPALMDYAGATIRFAAAPIWAQVYWPVLIAVLAGIGIALIDLVRPWRTLAVAIVDIAVNLFSVAVIVFMLRAGRFVDVFGDGAHAQQVTRASYWINASLSWTFTVLGAVILLDVLYEIWKMARARQSGTLRAV